ncbi:MAG: CPBP family glutamic-type intramembrane protease [Gemmataceae bacterium]
MSSRTDAEGVLWCWEAGARGLVARQADGTTEDGRPALPGHLPPLPELQPLVVADPDDAVRQGKADLGVRVLSPGGWRIRPGGAVRADLELLYRTGSTYGPEAARYLELLTADANSQLLDPLVRRIRADLRGDPVRVRTREVADESGKRTSLVPVLIPLILILMTMTGAVYPAIDLTAGERERNTLEMLIAAPIPRLSVLLAKYLAVLTVAMLTALVNLGSMALTLRVTGIGPAVFGPTLSWLTFVQVLLLLVLFATFFSAVVLSLTSFARSFKEAQAYLVPLMLLSFAPGVMALLPGLSLHGPLAVVPLVNIVLLARDVFEGTASAPLAALVVVATLLYAVAAVSVAARLFGAEAVLSTEAGSWADLVRRPRAARPAAEPASALLCLAVMFPVYFYLNLTLAQVASLDLPGRLIAAAAGQLVLFGLLPMFAAWWGRVRLAGGFRLHVAGWRPFLAAGLLGISLWPLVHELILLQTAVGLRTLRPELAEQIRQAMAGWREHSPLLLVAVLAVLPAVLEELFFRGYLLAALLGDEKRHPGRAVVVSAALFALFHLLVTDSLAIERFVPSLALGLVLGLLAVRSGSVLPGIVLHLTHNALLVLLGYYQPELTAAGWLTPDQDHLPLVVLLASAATTAVGLWVIKNSPQRTQRDTEEKTGE